MILYTIGVYGKTEDQFFNQLTDANVKLFIDVRLRRGMRGKKYSFVNSKALQLHLSEHGIHYLHVKALAPPKEMRQIQSEADKKARVLKSERSALSPVFVSEYKQEILLDDVVAKLYGNISGYESACLFCVESEAEACHRSLIAEVLVKKYEVEIRNL